MASQDRTRKGINSIGVVDGQHRQPAATTKETLFEDYENACAFLGYCNDEHGKALLVVIDAEVAVNEAEAALRAYLSGAE